MMTRLVGLALRFGSALALIMLAGPAALAQQTSRCADCHYAQVDVPAPDHLRDWDRSPHAQNNVGCEKCHGGNSTSFESVIAHRGILPSTDKKSPVNRANLPATCGGCHVGPFVAFQSSRHYELLKTGNEHGPTCSTCHDAVAGTLLSPKALESQCANCHGPKEVAPRAERARQARTMYESLSVIQKEFKLASAMIKKVDDRQRRADLLEEYRQADVPLTRAISAGHKFVYDDLEQYLGVAQTRVETLMSHIANRAQ
jgi:Cytochrome c554 and c-prime